MIEKYNSFIGELLLENAINEGKIFYSPPLREVIKILTLSKTNNEIATDLKNAEGKIVEPDITFLDIDKDGYLSFISLKDAKILLNNRYNYTAYDDSDISTSNNIWDGDINGNGSGVFTKSRNSIKLGKLINKMFPDKYNSAQIEEFVNKFKSRLVEASEVFEITSGKDIDKWYWHENYIFQTGNLGGSCMKSKKYFDMYVNNPEVCRLLILKDKELDKILGRALVWKINSINIKYGIKDTKFEYFMDRVYTTKDSDLNKFKEYAHKQGWAHKVYNDYRSHKEVIFNHNEYRIDMTVLLTNKGDYSYYPYMDTFAIYDRKTGTLYNDNEKSMTYMGYYVLNNTDGDRYCIK